jgi:hypothetical protein
MVARNPTPSRRGRSAEETQSPQASLPAHGHGADLELELSRLGCLPTKADPVFYRGLGKTGFGLFLYLEKPLDLQTLVLLANSRDRGVLLRRMVRLA